MRDALLIAVIATPWLIGFGVFCWLALSLVAGSVVGRVIRFGENPYDFERDA